MKVVAPPSLIDGILTFALATDLFPHRKGCKSDYVPHHTLLLALDPMRHLVHRTLFRNPPPLELLQ
ncbi:MAG: hypothetical protein ACYS19_12520 [Planctomycetota bacterium]